MRLQIYEVEPLFLFEVIARFPIDTSNLSLVFFWSELLLVVGRVWLPVPFFVNI